MLRFLQSHPNHMFIPLLTTGCVLPTSPDVWTITSSFPMAPNLTDLCEKLSLYLTHNVAPKQNSSKQKYLSLHNPSHWNSSPMFWIIIALEYSSTGIIIAGFPPPKLNLSINPLLKPNHSNSPCEPKFSPLPIAAIWVGMAVRLTVASHHLSWFNKQGFVGAILNFFTNKIRK